MKINKIGIVTIIWFSFIAYDLINKIGEKKTLDSEYWMWHDSLFVFVIIVLLFLAGKYSKFENL